jgi:ParB-like chromosome segregation protein Spo0J
MSKDFIQIKVSELIPASWNYKKKDKFLQEKLTKYLKEDGQIINLVVREMTTGQYEVIDGNHRLESLKEAGIDDVWVYNVGVIDQNEAKLLSIKLNELKFDYDEDELASILNDLKFDDNVDFDVPFTEEKLDYLDSLVEDMEEGLEDNVEQEMIDGMPKDALDYNDGEIDIIKDEPEEKRAKKKSDIKGETAPDTEYLLVYFDNVSDFEHWKKLLGLNKQTRRVSFGEVYNAVKRDLL